MNSEVPDGSSKRSHLFRIIAGISFVVAASSCCQSWAAGSDSVLGVEKSSTEPVCHDIENVFARGREAPNDEICASAEKGESESDLRPPSSIHDVSPRFIEADIRIIRRSTGLKCAQGYMTSIDVSVRYAGEKFRAHKKLWREVGTFLTELIYNPPDKDWRTAFYAAQILRRMGSPYQQKAYQFFLEELGRIGNAPHVSDDQREEAVMLIDQFYFDYPDGPYEGFYQPFERKAPRALFRIVNSRLQLLEFWESCSDMVGMGPSYKKLEMNRFLQFKRLVEGS